MKKGFTTIEIIVVGVFITILAMITGGAIVGSRVEDLGAGLRVTRTFQGGTGTSSDIVSGAQFLIGNPTNARYDVLELTAGSNITFSTSTDGTFGISTSGGASVFGALTDVATSSDATGDVWYLNSSGQIVNLGVGSNTNVLTLASGIPSWVAPTGGGDPFAWTVVSALKVSTSTELQFDIGFVSQASSTIDSNLVITGHFSASSTASIANTLTMGGSIISDTDSTDDLGSASVLWANVYADALFLVGVTDQKIVAVSSSANKIKYRFHADGNSYFQIQVDDQLTNGVAFAVVGLGAGSFFQFGEDIISNSGCCDLGKSANFFDETFTDELVLLNGGTSATAANTVRLGGLDLSAGDAGLLITTENDTEHLFASLVGISTTTPDSTLTVEGNFAVGTNGTEFTVSSSGVVGAGTWNGTDIAVADGGTGVSSFTQYLILYADTTTSLSQIAIGTAGQVLTSAGAGAVAAFETLSVSSGEYAAASIDGDDINSNIAGRSLTLTSASPDTLDADVELYTESATANIHATSSNTLATSTVVWLSKQFPQAATITRIDCYALDSGTSTIQAEIRSSAISAGSDILYQTGLNCGADEEIASTTLQNVAIAAQDWITIDLPDAEPTGSRPRVVFVSITWTWND